MHSWLLELLARDRIGCSFDHHSLCSCPYLLPDPQAARLSEPHGLQLVLHQQNSTLTQTLKRCARSLLLAALDKQLNCWGVSPLEH